MEITNEKNIVLHEITHNIQILSLAKIFVIEDKTPGLSLTPIIVILESFFVEVIPVIIWLLKAFLGLVTNVPFFFIKEDLTFYSKLV